MRYLICRIFTEIFCKIAGFVNVIEIMFSEMENDWHFDKSHERKNDWLIEEDGTEFYVLGAKLGSKRRREFSVSQSAGSFCSLFCSSSVCDGN